MSAFGEDNAGEIYICEYDSGVLYTLERNEGAGKNSNFPTKLSETGLFKDVTKHEMAEGVIKFEPNAKQWADRATARWFLALPGQTSVTAFDKPRQLPGQVFWHEFKMQFPKDAVLVKTISLDAMEEHGVAHVMWQDGRRLETQLLHFDGEDWRGYSFAWRDDQTDADLVPAEGAEKMLTVHSWFDGNEKCEKVWTYPSRAQCMSCHNAWSEYALAFNTAQLNNDRHIASGKSSQLLDLTSSGFIRRVDAKDKPLPPFDDTTVRKEAVVASPYREEYSLDERARGYLQANCAHCHRFGGGGGQVVFEMDVSKPLKDTGLLDAQPRQGDFGIPGARLIAPGDPYHSVLFYRMAKFGHGRMPHLGSELPDPAGLHLMDAWIRSMGASPRRDQWLPRDASRFEKARDSVETALPYARVLGKLTPSFDDRRQLLAAAAKLQPGPVRDLFEGYLPPDPKGRKIGSNPRPASILAKTGDAKTGEAIFFNKELKCVNCHKVGDKGVSLGPDLSAIGKTRSKAELLDSILQPSAKVDPQYASYLVKTHDGRSFTGLLVKRDEKQVVLRDAENKEIVLAGDNVEAVQPSRLSLMPDGAVSGLTPQEAADLVEYLATRK